VEGFVGKNTHSIISVDGKNIAAESSSYYGIASITNESYSSGKKRFAFQYKNGTTGIGVASIDSNLDGYWILGKNDPAKQRCLCVSNDDKASGLKFPAEVRYCDSFTIGDIIEMEVDFDNGTIEYFKNSQSLGICFNDVNSLPKPLYCVVCVVVKGNGAGTLSLNDFSNAIPAPDSLVAVAGDSKVTLSWDAVTGATGYNVKRSITAGGPYSTIASNVSGTSYVDTDVVNGTTYYYVVTAISADGESTNSNEASATPVASPVEEGEAVLRVTMTDSSEREYKVSKVIANDFVAWCNRTIGTGNSCYAFDKSILDSKEYLFYEKIISFEVIPLA